MKKLLITLCLALTSFNLGLANIISKSESGGEVLSLSSDSEALKNMLLQNYFPAKGIRFKWTSQTENMQTKQSHKENCFLAFDLTLPALKFIRYEDNGDEITKAYREDCITTVTKLKSEAFGKIEAGNLGTIFPNVLQAWILPRPHSSELVILNEKSIDLFEISKEDNSIVLLSNGWKFIFYPNSFDLHIVEYWSNSGMKDAYLISRGTMEKYTKVGNYSFPLVFKSESFNKNGILNSRTLLNVDKDSLYLGTLSPEDTKIDFASGTVISNTITGKSIIITDASEVSSNENIITQILEGKLSFDVADKDYSPPKTPEEFEADFYNSLLGKEEKTKTRGITAPQMK